MTATQDLTSFRTMEPGQVRQGDLLLVTQIPGEPLGQMMESLDGTRFSHSGIATREPGGDPDGPATHLASALATKLEGDGFDLGGVRWDPFHDLWDKQRDLYCIPMTDDQRQKALAHLGVFRPEPDDEGTFSVVKLVAVAVALRSFELQTTEPGHAEALFAAAADIATAWAATDDEPSYYCAELVATAYGRPFTRAEMVPPEGCGIGGDLEEPWWLGRLAELLSERFDRLDDARGRAWAGLISALAGGDWDFVIHAIGASTRSAFFMLGRRGEGSAKAPDRLRESAPGHPSLAHTDVVVPHALVTPRMLWSVFGRDAAGNDLIRRITRPPRR